MYHAVLTNRYLTTRVIPFIAVAAVALCVALVIIVVSVMTGFLDMVKSSGRKLMGDVVVSYPVSGIPYYERLIERIEQLPEAGAATPVVDSWGLLKMPYPDGPNKQTETVQIWGIDSASFSAVTGYDDTLYWREIDDDQWNRLFRDRLRSHWPDLLESLPIANRLEVIRGAYPDSLDELPDDSTLARVAEWLEQLPEAFWEEAFFGIQFHPDALRAAIPAANWDELLAGEPRLLDRSVILEEGRELRRRSDGRPGLVAGMHVSEGNERQHDGSYRALLGGHWWMPRFDVTLTTLPIAEGASLDPESYILPVLNEFVSGVFLIDDKRVMIPIDLAQQLLHLDEAEAVDDDGEVLGLDPPRATMVLVRAAEGVSPDELRDQVKVAYDAFRDDVMADETAVRLPPPAGMGLTIRTWLQQQSQFIGPIEKERELMRTLFSLVYLVCAGLVLSIFWAIVYEKTRDIGILRSMGATRLGISWIFLRYGLVIGVFGAIAGLGLGTLVVHNINVIHDAIGNPPRWLAGTVGGVAVLSLVVTVARGTSGRLLPVVLGSIVTLTFVLIAVVIQLIKYLVGGIVIWDAAVYYFTEIPNAVDYKSAMITMAGAVVFSLLGAFIPAAKAADTDPVKALRYE